MKTYAAGSHTHDLYPSDGVLAVRGDGTDETAAFHSAIAAGHDVLVPSGTYRVNLVETSIAGLRLHGMGASSILRPFNLAKPALKMTGSVAGLEMDHLAIDGRFRDGASIAPVFLQDATWVSIHDCAFTDAFHRAINFSNNLPGSDIYPPRKTRVWIERNTFLNNQLDAIFLGNVGEFWVRENYIEGAPDCAIDGGQGAENGVIENNIIVQTASAGTGIFMSDFQKNIRISGNIILGNPSGGTGIHVSGGDYTGTSYLITDNLVDGSSISIEAEGAAGGLISGNRLLHSDYGAMDIRVGSNGTYITGNLVSDPAGASLWLTSAGVTFLGNVFGGGAFNLSGAGVGTVVS